MIERFKNSKLVEILLTVVFIFAVIIDAVAVVATLLGGLGALIAGSLPGALVCWLMCAVMFTFGMWLFGAFNH